MYINSSISSFLNYVLARFVIAIFALLLFYVPISTAESNNLFGEESNATGKTRCVKTFDEDDDPAGIEGYIKPRACIWAGDDTDGQATTGERTDRPITFGSWENEQCGTSGYGWHQRQGSCGTGRGTGYKRCRQVRLLLENC